MGLSEEELEVLAALKRKLWWTHLKWLKYSTKTVLESRLNLVQIRLKMLFNGEDAAGGFLLLHTLFWFVVLALPSQSLPDLPPKGAPQPTFASSYLPWQQYAREHGFHTDQVLAAVYLPLLILSILAVMRWVISKAAVAFCLLLVLAMNVGLAVVFLSARPASLVAVDALITAVMAWWAYRSVNRA